MIDSLGQLETRFFSYVQSFERRCVQTGDLVLSVRETYGEKLRAALTRREPAIRDFYDIDHAVRSGRIDISDDRLLHIVREKIAIPDNAPVDVTTEKLRLLEQQRMGRLKPVLRAADYDQFDLSRAFKSVATLADSL